MAEVLIARESAVVNVDGEPQRIRKNATRIAADSQLAKDHPELFKPADENVKFPTRTARATPKVKQPEQSEK